MLRLVLTFLPQLSSDWRVVVESRCLVVRRFLRRDVIITRIMFTVVVYHVECEVDVEHSEVSEGAD